MTTKPEAIPRAAAHFCLKHGARKHRTTLEGGSRLPGCAVYVCSACFQDHMAKKYAVEYAIDDAVERGCKDAGL